MKALTWNDYKEEAKVKGDKEAKEINVIEKTVEIISKIIKKRKEKNISQKELGELVGLKQSAIARMENFKHEPRLDTLLKIISVLNMKIEILNEEDCVFILKDSITFNIQSMSYLWNRIEPKVVYHSSKEVCCLG